MAQICRRCTHGNFNGKCSLTGKFTYETTDKEIENSNYPCFKERVFAINYSLDSGVDNIYLDPLSDKALNKLNTEALVIKSLIKQKES